MTEFKQPFFFSTFFTISSHNLYIVPEKYKGKFPKGTTKIQESIAYADYAFKTFFLKWLRKKKIGTKTLFL